MPDQPALPTDESLQIQTTSQPEDGDMLVATILSTYDLPAEMKPISVIMECPSLGISVKTGPPLARHKDSNSFKFLSNKANNPGANDLIIKASLAKLYSAVLMFRVVFKEDVPDLYSKMKLSTTLRINEIEWLILNLESTDPSVSLSSKSTDESPSLPTLRVKMKLSGSYRPEINAVLTASSSYFSVVDSLNSNVKSTVNALTVTLPSQLPAAKYLLIPAVPLAAGSVAFAPVVLGVLVLGVPFILPILIILFTVVLSTGGIFGTLYFSSQDGRAQLGEIVEPLFSSFCCTPVGQRFIYDTGPRPNPVQVARLIVPSDMFPKLIFSLMIDFIGSSSYLVPLVGEATDVLWAPVQFILVSAMYESVSPNLKFVSLVEELLPLTDVIPTATMGWISEFGPGLVMGKKESGGGKVVLSKREQFAITKHA